MWKFVPILKQTLWGGTHIIPFKRLKDTKIQIGESWEISSVSGFESVVAEGEDEEYTISQLIDKYKDKLLGTANYKLYGNRFPLLVKFIDAEKDLSIQVHPDDKTAYELYGTNGKTEMWYVVNAADGAFVCDGFSKKIMPEEYIRMVNDGTITDAVQSYPVKTGDVFFLPAGRIHGIGAGTFLVEIQQTSDITYRIYDYKRKDEKGNYRPLQAEAALNVLDLSVNPDNRTVYQKKKNKPEILVKCDYFTSRLYDLTLPYEIDYTNIDSFVVWIIVDGSCRIEQNGKQTEFRAGDTVLFPATTEQVNIEPEVQVKFLEVYISENTDEEKELL